MTQFICHFLNWVNILGKDLNRNRFIHFTIIFIEIRMPKLTILLNSFAFMFKEHLMPSKPLNKDIM